MPDTSHSSSGQHDLAVLLKTMSPTLRDGEYVFCSVPEAEFSHLRLGALGMFREAEGVTLILTVEQARQANLSIGPCWRLITLSVHSDLEAVGFLAAITTALAEVGISVNAISAYYHDHLLVPSHLAEAALDCLMALSSRSDQNIS
jgi:hypothetical protein